MVTNAYLVSNRSKELARLFERRKEIEARITQATEAQEVRVALLAHCKKAGATRSDVMWIYHQLPPTRITKAARLKRAAHATNKGGNAYPPKAELMPFGKRIRELRKVKKLNSAAVGKAVGMHGSMVTGWEAGKWRPKPDTVAKLEKLFGVALKNLLPNGKEK